MSRLRRAALAGCTLVVLAGCSLAESAPKRDAGTPPASATASTPAASASATASASVANTPPRPPPPKGWGDETKWSGTIEEQNELLLEELRYFHQLDDATMSRLKEIFTASKVMAQGNPKPTKHPMSPAACEQKLETEGVSYHNREFERICGGKWEAPLYDPETQKPSDATTCIDQFEFPNIPCRYPVTWARARDAVLVCQAQGKRMCDAHEWEGACYGKLEPHQYNFGLAKKMKQDEAFRAMRKQHNYRIEEKDQRWAFGPEFKKGICATGSKKSKKCNPGGWKTCGSNTYPSGAFPKCANPLQVFDIHGNAAEHMNLPVLPEQMATS
jgi:hypothetical protein